MEFFSAIIHERISDFFAKCGLGHQASPRRRQSHASLAEIEWRRELGHHHFNMPSNSTPATLQFPCAFPAVIAYCSCGKAGCPCPHFTGDAKCSRIMPVENCTKLDTVVPSGVFLLCKNLTFVDQFYMNVSRSEMIPI